MAKVLATGISSTPISGVTSPEIVIPLQNWHEDFGVQVDDPGELIVTAVTSPVDQPAIFRISQRANANVYAKSPIDPAAYLPVKSGTETLIERKEVWSLTDTLDAAYGKLMPVRCGITITVPASAEIKDSDVLNLVLRTLAGLFDSSDPDGSTVVNALLHGVLKPSSL
jgi:hypothetical protein